MLRRALLPALILLGCVWGAACVPNRPTLSSSPVTPVTPVSADPLQISTATPTRTATPTSTAPPTATPTHLPTPTLTPTPPPRRVMLEPMNYQMQTYNNCGPASVAIILGYYDHWITQHQVNEELEAGCSPCALADYVDQYGLAARVYEPPPSQDMTRFLLANDIPVIALHQLEIGSDIGHYRVIKGYDDDTREFISDDPLRVKGADSRISYNAFIGMSRHGVFIPVYLPEKDALVQALMEELHAREVLECPP